MIVEMLYRLIPVVCLATGLAAGQVSSQGGAQTDNQATSGLTASNVIRASLFGSPLAASSPTFATGVTESSKRLIVHWRRFQGRHHSGSCHVGGRTLLAITLGGGWSGRLIFKRWSRMAWSASGSV